MQTGVELWLQVTWFTLATAFNIMSMRALAEGHRGWGGPNAKSAQVVVTLIGLVIAMGYFAWSSAYGIAAGVVAALLVVGGIGRHIVADASDYASGATRWAGVGINVLGALAFAMGALRAYSHD